MAQDDGGITMRTILIIALTVVAFLGGTSLSAKAADGTPVATPTSVPTPAAGASLLTPFCKASDDKEKQDGSATPTPQPTPSSPPKTDKPDDKCAWGAVGVQHELKTNDATATPSAQATAAPKFTGKIDLHYPIRESGPDIDVLGASTFELSEADVKTLKGYNVDPTSATFLKDEQKAISCSDCMKPLRDRTASRLERKKYQQYYKDILQQQSDRAKRKFAVEAPDLAPFHLDDLIYDPSLTSLPEVHNGYVFGREGEQYRYGIGYFQGETNSLDFHDVVAHVAQERTSIHAIDDWSITHVNALHSTGRVVNSELFLRNHNMASSITSSLRYSTQYQSKGASIVGLAGVEGWGPHFLPGHLMDFLIGIRSSGDHFAPTLGTPDTLSGTFGPLVAMRLGNLVDGANGQELQRVVSFNARRAANSEGPQRFDFNLNATGPLMSWKVDTEKKIESHFKWAAVFSNTQVSGAELLRENQNSTELATKANIDKSKQYLNRTASADIDYAYNSAAANFVAGASYNLKDQNCHVDKFQCRFPSFVDRNGSYKTTYLTTSGIFAFAKINDGLSSTKLDGKTATGSFAGFQVPGNAAHFGCSQVYAGNTIVSGSTDPTINGRTFVAAITIPALRPVGFGLYFDVGWQWKRFAPFTPVIGQDTALHSSPTVQLSSARATDKCNSPLSQFDVGS